MKSGTIIGKTYGIRINQSNSTLTLGVNGSELSTTNPYVEGGIYSIYQTAGTMNFYSGLLKGYTKAYSGTFNNIRADHEIFEDFDETESYLIKNRTYNTTETSSEPIENTAKEGNGYAKLTYIENTIIEDKEELVNYISNLINKGQYPNNLYE